jgi:Flagellar biosynthesis protein, FliO
MTGTSEVMCNPISKAISAGPISTSEPIHVWAALLRVWKWLTRCSRGVLVRGVSRRLKVAETVSLGEKRFISILQVDGEQFLVGGSASNVVLLARLEVKPENPGAGLFESVLSRVESSSVGSEEDGRNRIEVTR